MENLVMSINTIKRQRREFWPPQEDQITTGAKYTRRIYEYHSDSVSFTGTS